MKNHTTPNINKLRQKCHQLWRILGLVGFVFIAVALFSLSAAAQNSGAAERWVGSYSFEETGQLPKKRRKADVAPFISFDVTVERADDKLKGIFSVNGTQIFEAYECSIVARDDKLEFYYERFVAEGAEDRQKLQKGVLLFTLVEMREGKQKQYLFQPAMYKITRLNKAGQNQRIYFNKHL